MKHLIPIIIGSFLFVKGFIELIDSNVEWYWQLLWFVAIGGFTLGMVYHWKSEGWKW